jgi:hypothetical protein
MCFPLSVIPSVSPSVTLVADPLLAACCDLSSLCPGAHPHTSCDKLGSASSSTSEGFFHGSAHHSANGCGDGYPDSHWRRGVVPSREEIDSLITIFATRASLKTEVRPTSSPAIVNVVQLLWLTPHPATPLLVFPKSVSPSVSPSVTLVADPPPSRAAICPLSVRELILTQAATRPSSTSKGFFHGSAHHSANGRADRYPDSHWRRGAMPSRCSIC